MTVAPITGTDVNSYIADTAGNKASTTLVQVVNADGTPAGGGSSTSPSIVGGEYNSTAPTLTNGQTDALQLSSDARLTVSAVNQTSAADSVSNNNLGLVVDRLGTARHLGVLPYIYNGASWDRMRGDTTGTFVKSNPLAGTDRSVTATTTSAQLMAANTTRSKFFIKNDTAIVVWINMGATAVASAGSGNISIAANGGYFEFTGYSGVVNIIAASTTAAVTAREF